MKSRNEEEKKKLIFLIRLKLQKNLLIRFEEVVKRCQSPPEHMDLNLDPFQCLGATTERVNSVFAW